MTIELTTLRDGGQPASLVADKLIAFFDAAQHTLDVAIYDAFMQVKNGTWKGGVTYKGLKEGGVDWALDSYNEKLVTPEMKAKVEAAKADIVSGKIVVHDYMSDNSCK